MAGCAWRQGMDWNVPAFGSSGSDLARLLAGLVALTLTGAGRVGFHVALHLTLRVAIVVAPLGLVLLIVLSGGLRLAGPLRLRAARWRVGVAVVLRPALVAAAIRHALAILLGVRAGARLIAL